MGLSRRLADGGRNAHRIPASRRSNASQAAFTRSGCRKGYEPEADTTGRSDGFCGDNRCSFTRSSLFVVARSGLRNHCWVRPLGRVLSRHLSDAASEHVCCGEHQCRARSAGRLDRAVRIGPSSLLCGSAALGSGDSACAGIVVGPAPARSHGAGTSFADSF